MLADICFSFLYCREPIITCCPVCGETLEVSDKLNNMIHLTLCFDEGTGNQVMKGGFLTDLQASYGWEICQDKEKENILALLLFVTVIKSHNWMLQSNFIFVGGCSN